MLPAIMKIEITAIATLLIFSPFILELKALNVCASVLRSLIYAGERRKKGKGRCGKSRVTTIAMV